MIIMGNRKILALGLVGLLGGVTVYQLSSSKQKPEPEPEKRITVEKAQEKIIITLYEGEKEKIMYTHTFAGYSQKDALYLTQTKLWVFDGLYPAKQDTIPDAVSRGNYTYARNDPNTELLFQKVDELWNKYRKELDVERIIKEELAKPAPRPESILE